jgi:nicotinamide mononucleotide adenylyltransferase
MDSKFNKFYNKIILEYSETDVESNSYEFINETIALVPGSFKPPHKGHWEMILEYAKLADKVFIFISNISRKVNANRTLSKSNLQQLAKIINIFETKEQFKVNQKIYNKIDKIFSKIKTEIDNISWNKLSEYLNKINDLILNTEDIEECYNKLNERLINFGDNLSEKIFKSVRDTETEIDIEPEMAKQIFELFINVYNLQDKVFVIIPDGPSPMTAVIPFVNDKCKDCTIYLGSSKKGEDDTRWDSFLKSFESNPTNTIIPYPIDVQTMISATDIRNNITRLDKSMFPDNLTLININEIKQILGL